MRGLILLFVLIPFFAFAQNIIIEKNMFGELVAKDKTGKKIATRSFNEAYGELTWTDNFGNVIQRETIDLLGNTVTRDRLGAHIIKTGSTNLLGEYEERNTSGEIISTFRGNLLGEVEKIDKNGRVVGRYQRQIDGSIVYTDETSKNNSWSSPSNAANPSSSNNSWSSPSNAANPSSSNNSWSSPSNAASLSSSNNSWSSPSNAANPSRKSNPGDSYRNPSQPTPSSNAQSFQSIQDGLSSLAQNLSANSRRVRTSTFYPNRNKSAFKKLKVELVKGFGSLNFTSRGADPLFVGAKLLKASDELGVRASPSSPYFVNWTYRSYGDLHCDGVHITKFNMSILDNRLSGYKKIAEVSFTQNAFEMKCIDDIIYQALKRLVAQNASFTIGDYEEELFLISP